MMLFFFMFLFFHASLFTAECNSTSPVSPVLLKYAYELRKPKNSSFDVYYEGGSYKDGKLIGIALYGLLKPEYVSICNYDSYIINIVSQPKTLQTRFLVLSGVLNHLMQLKQKEVAVEVQMENRIDQQLYDYCEFVPYVLVGCNGKEKYLYTKNIEGAKK